MKQLLSSFLPKHQKLEDSQRARTVDVGWLLQTDKAGFIWDAPRKLSRTEGKITHAKGLSYCPAVVDFEARLFEVPCPVDIQLRFMLDDGKGKPALVNIAGNNGTIRPKYLNQMLAVVGRNEWRHPDRPLI